MIKKGIKITLALGVAGVFLWLAFRNVHVKKVWEHAQNITLWWILPFGATVFMSNILRAVRWQLLIEHEKKNVSRVTLLAGVLTGYLLNFVGPRFGDMTRPVYVAKRENMKSSKMIGTIVLERAIDLATMILLMVFVAVYLVSDLGVLRQIFGNKTMDLLTGGVPLITTLWSIFALLILAVLGFFAVKGIHKLSEKFEKVHEWLLKAREVLQEFKEGLLSIREVKHWWLFLLYTVLLWSCYTLMSYIPFYMFHMPSQFGLGIPEAITITVISAIGIAIPVPGGIGTYHYFVKQTLLVLFAVPAVTGLAYATVTHAATLLMVALFTPIVLMVDKYRQTKEGKEPA